MSCDPDQRPPGLPGRLRRLRRADVLGTDVPVAETRRSRLLGLALLPRERAGAGLLIPRCRSVHTVGMRFALDVVFLDSRGAVIGVRCALGPGRVARNARAASVLELPSAREATPPRPLDMPVGEQ
jgi:uncharacterized membrane protein (UPF0127 family)